MVDVESRGQLHRREYPGVVMASLNSICGSEQQTGSSVRMTLLLFYHEKAVCPFHCLPRLGLASVHNIIVWELAGACFRYVNSCPWKLGLLANIYRGDTLSRRFAR